MTELDMIRRAQMYMEKLSHGINPLDGTPVAAGDLIRNGRMSRCFAFVAEVLDKVVTNSAPHAKNRSLPHRKRACGLRRAGRAVCRPSSPPCSVRPPPSSLRPAPKPSPPVGARRSTGCRLPYPITAARISPIPTGRFRRGGRAAHSRPRTREHRAAFRLAPARLAD